VYSQNPFKAILPTTVEVSNRSKTKRSWWCRNTFGAPFLCTVYFTQIQDLI